MNTVSTEHRPFEIHRQQEWAERARRSNVYRLPPPLMYEPQRDRTGVAAISLALFVAAMVAVGFMGLQHPILAKIALMLGVK